MALLVVGSCGTESARQLLRFQPIELKVSPRGGRRARRVQRTWSQTPFPGYVDDFWGVDNFEPRRKTRPTSGSVIHPSFMIRNLMIRNSGSHRPGFLQIFESLTPRDPDNQLPNGGGAQSYPRLIRRLYNFMYFWVPWALVYFGGLRN